MQNSNFHERVGAARGIARQEHDRARDAIARAEATVARARELRRRLARPVPVATAGSPVQPEGEPGAREEARAADAIARARQSLERVMGLLRETAVQPDAGQIGIDDEAPAERVVAAEGGSFRVALAPREGGRGRPAGHALVFESETGGWIGSIPLCGFRTLAAASEAELVELMAWAREKGVAATGGDQPQVSD